MKESVSQQSSEIFIPESLRGEYKLFLFVFSPTETIVTRGRTLDEARKVFNMDKKTYESSFGRGYYIKSISELSLGEQEKINNDYSKSHPFDWKTIPPQVLLDECSKMSSKG